MTHQDLRFLIGRTVTIGREPYCIEVVNAYGRCLAFRRLANGKKFRVVFHAEQIEDGVVTGEVKSA